MAKTTTQPKEKRRVSIPTTITGYENLLIRMIEKRTGAAFDEFLFPQVSACAQTWMMLNRVHRDLMKENSLIDPVTGSMGQAKFEVNVLLPYYLKLQAELRLQFETLGLNYRATPSKIKEDTKKGVDETDPMARMMAEAQKALED